MGHRIDDIKLKLKRFRRRFDNLITSLQDVLGLWLTLMLFPILMGIVLVREAWDKITGK
jgi:hypothetical protein